MKRFGDYRLIEFLAESNHGVYYRARPPERLGLTEDVTLKILVEDASDEQFHALAAEIRVLMQHRSPWLVHVHEPGHVRGRLFYAMEFMPMGTLAEPNVALDVRHRILAVSHATRGLHQLHELGLIHRDFKPAKILLHECGGKLDDLGVADWEIDHEKPIAPTGSIGYMAPEVARGSSGKRRSDLFAVAATIHLETTGKPVYPDVPRHDLLAAIHHVASEPPIIDPGLPAGLRGIVEQGLATDPDARPASALAIAEALDAYLEGLDAAEDLPADASGGRQGKNRPY